jgi:hypothetical protein
LLAWINSLAACASQNLREILAVFFKRQFERNSKEPSSDEDVDMEDDMDDGGTTQDEEGVSVLSTTEMSQMLKQLHWIGVVDEAMSLMLCAQIERRINEQCKVLTIHSLYTHFTLTIHSLYTHYTLTIHSLYTHYTLTIHSLYTHYTLTIHSLYTHYTLTIHSLYTHCTLTVHSLYTHYTHSLY